MKKLGLALLILVSVSACGGNDSSGDQGNIDNEVTETVLDDVDQIEGTISDAMINEDGLNNNSAEPVEGEEIVKKSADDSSNAGDTGDAGDASGTPSADDTGDGV